MRARFASVRSSAIRLCFLILTITTKSNTKNRVPTIDPIRTPLAPEKTNQKNESFKVFFDRALRPTTHWAKKTTKGNSETQSVA
eukprot:m.113161 g.113161  ORF g.113161 m.113161 type:complete len:84 (-) comp51861_c0_seq7:1161-1412(-)